MMLFQKSKSITALIVLVCLATLNAEHVFGEDGKDVTPEAIDFNRDIRPLLSRHCIACHGPDEADRQADLRLDTFAGATADLGGYAAVDLQHVEKSELLVRLTTTDEDLRMPPAEHAEELSAAEVEMFRRWIAEGAGYREHWAFVKPKQPNFPAKDGAYSPSEAIDHLLAERLAALGLKRNERASPASLVRKLSLDLTGLPPLAHDDAFQSLARSYIANPTESLYSQLVDWLLGSHAYAEHWASMWLDLARYADTVGYAGDERRSIWPWRDWLISALAENKSYKQMSIEMLAGDLLPNATDEQRLATAFHRNTLSNNEGGTQDEEFRTIAVKDRLSTTLNAWMGLTVRCAECHTHKYDPISHVEYYQLLDFFNQTEDSDKRDERPRLAVVPQRDEREQARLESELKTLQEKAANAEDVWRVTQPIHVESTAGTVLKVLDDASVLASGENPGSDTWRLKFVMEPSHQITALRLEVLPDSSHGGNVGRGNEGAFVLSQIRILAGAEQQENRKLVDAEDDFHQPKFEAKAAIADKVETKSKSGWAVRHPQTKYSSPRTAIFELERPIVASTDAQEFIVELRQDSHWTHSNLGRVRISFCSVEKPVAKYRKKQLEPLQRAVEAKMAELSKEVLVPVLKQVSESQARKTKVMIRGNYQSLGDEVSAEFPEAFRWESEFEKTRLGLAKWLFSEQNPLTARVAANRVWAKIIGRGIVLTQEDFGTQGAPPTHPELLDYLALYLQDQDWDLRQLMRAMVHTEAYRQSTVASEEALGKDPKNVYLSRGPRRRLSAEVIRDQALAIAGLLSDKRFGPPVYPPSPIKRIVNAFTGGMEWRASQGEDRYRRSLYTFMKRSSLHPLFETFDMANRDVCSMRRIETNTPLQSFMTLNDEGFIEAARALADLMLNGERDEYEAIRWGLDRALFRSDHAEQQLAIMMDLYASVRNEYKADPSNASKLLGMDDGKEGLPSEEMVNRAAMIIVANVILNLDSVLNN